MHICNCPSETLMSCRSHAPTAQSSSSWPHLGLKWTKSSQRARDCTLYDVVFHTASDPELSTVQGFKGQTIRKCCVPSLMSAVQLGLKSFSSISCSVLWNQADRFRVKYPFSQSLVV
jgi:hypothetical protein